jgi:hypothetical protein
MRKGYVVKTDTEKEMRKGYVVKTDTEKEKRAETRCRKKKNTKERKVAG